MTDIKAADQLPIHSCSFCDERFASRNKLFKHLADCSSSPRQQARKLATASNNKSISTHSSSDVDDVNLDNFAIYVTGGRVRGRTLGSVEKYSFKGNVSIQEPVQVPY